MADFYLEITHFNITFNLDKLAHLYMWYVQRCGRLLFTTPFRAHFNFTFFLKIG